MIKRNDSVNLSVLQQYGDSEISERLRNFVEFRPSGRAALGRRVLLPR
jgi:hypothetical protein